VTAIKANDPRIQDPVDFKRRQKSWTEELSKYSPRASKRNNLGVPRTGTSSWYIVFFLFGKSTKRAEISLKDKRLVPKKEQCHAQQRKFRSVENRGNKKAVKRVALT